MSKIVTIMVMTLTQGGAIHDRPSSMLVRRKERSAILRPYMRIGGHVPPLLDRILAVALFLLTSGVSMAQPDMRPKNLRVCVQFIEMPHPVLTELLSGKAESGDVVHQKAMTLAKEGKAKLLESCMIMGQSGRKSTVELIRELIYPTEYSPTCQGLFGPEVAPPPSPPPPNPPTPRPPLTCPVAYETRNTGVTLEIEPTVDEIGQLIDLRFIPEIVDVSRLETIMKYTDEWGDASYRQPIFETLRSNTTVTLVNGKFELAATITPKPADLVPATPRKILVFVRCDVLPVGK